MLSNAVKLELDVTDVWAVRNHLSLALRVLQPQHARRVVMCHVFASLVCVNSVRLDALCAIDSSRQTGQTASLWHSTLGCPLTPFLPSKLLGALRFPNE